MMTVDELIERAQTGESVSDEEILTVGGYGWENFSPDRLEDVEPFLALQARWRGLQHAEPVITDEMRDRSIEMANALWREDATPVAQGCSRCGQRPAAWIPGAGEALCERHQDSY